MHETLSLDKLNPKIAQAICCIGQVIIDEKDKGKENCFAVIQDKNHAKKSNKAGLDLTPMSKENKVILFLCHIRISTLWMIDLFTFLGFLEHLRSFWRL